MPKEKKPKQKEFVLKVLLFSTLRGVFKKTPMYNQARSRAKEEYFTDSKHGKKIRRVHYICAICDGRFEDRVGNREVQIDHLEPVINPETGFVDFNTYIDRLFCPTEGLQLLCKSCHSKKSKEENKLRKKKKVDKDK
jgi:hypothetical protein